MTLRDTKVFVTGGAGFIGSHLVDELVARGNAVVVLDNLSTGSREHIARHEASKAVTFIHGDVADAGACRRAVAGCQAVFHLATRNVRLSLAQPTTVHDTNATGMLEILKAAAAGAVARFVYMSSSEVLGTAVEVPMKEVYPYAPETIYGASKLAGEYYTSVFHRAGWLDTMVVRPFNNYGPREHYEGDKGEVIPRFILRTLAGLAPTVFGDGLQTRDFTYVTDTARLTVKLAECDAALGRIVNVCTNRETSVREIAETVVKLVGADVAPEYLPGRPSDVLRLYGDNSLLAELLGETPDVGLEEGLEKTIAYFRETVPDPAAWAKEDEPRAWEQIPRERWLDDAMRHRSGG